MGAGRTRTRASGVAKGSSTEARVGKETSRQCDAAVTPDKSGATYLLGFLVFAVLHYEVDVAEHSFYRVRICQVEGEELDKWVIFDLHRGRRTRVSVQRLRVTYVDRSVHAERKQQNSVVRAPGVRKKSEN